MPCTELSEAAKLSKTKQDLYAFQNAWLLSTMEINLRISLAFLSSYLFIFWHISLDSFPTLRLINWGLKRRVYYVFTLKWNTVWSYCLKLEYSYHQSSCFTSAVPNRLIHLLEIRIIQQYIGEFLIRVLDCPRHRSSFKIYVSYTCRLPVW